MNIIRSIAKPQYLYRPARSAARILRSFKGDRAQRVTVRLPWGVSICIDTGERIGSSIWRSGVHDLAVVEALWRLLDEGTTAIDVGANIGYTAGLMARRVGASGRVVCFEPQPDLFHILQSNLSLVRERDDVGAIDVHQVALSDRAGQATLVCENGSNHNVSGSRIEAAGSKEAWGRRLTVATGRLDDFVAEGGIALAKIDVEGHELQVLRGAERALAAGSIEHIVYEDFGGQLSPVHRLLNDYGYSLFALGWATRKPVLTSIAHGPAVNLACESPNYLATRSPAKAVRRFRAWGWSVI